MAPDSVSVVIDGEAVAKGRPRFTRGGIPYTPANSRKWEAHARLAAQEAMEGREPFTTPVAVHITVALPIPASWSGKKRHAAVLARIRPTSRPDLDNYIKAAMDALNTIVFTDDCLVVELTAEKHYSKFPRLAITVTRIEPPPLGQVAEPWPELPLGAAA